MNSLKTTLLGICLLVSPFVARADQTITDQIENDDGSPYTVSSGTVTVLGSGAIIYPNSKLAVSGPGNNPSLIIQDGGQVTAESALIGFNLAQTALVTVEGVDASGHSSVLSLNGTLSVGGSGMPNSSNPIAGGGTLLIQNGGQVTNLGGPTIVGDVSAFASNLTVTGINAQGPASSLTAQQLIIGYANINAMATFAVQDGGQVSSTSAIIGASYTFINSSSQPVPYEGAGTVTVSGANADGTASTWSNSGNLNMFSTSPGNVAILTVSNGGKVTTGSLTIGAIAGATTKINLDSGGILETGTITTLNGGTTFNVDGGILRATADNANFVQGSAPFSAPTGTMSLGTGGGTIDNDGHAIGFALTISGTGTLTTAGLGTLTLSGTNTYTGGTQIDAGTLALASAKALGSTGAISFNGGTLQYSASNTTDYSSRFSAAAGQQYNIDTNGQNVTWASALTSAGGSLSKSGLGTLTLTGSNTYTGGTSLNGGVLSLGSATALGSTNSISWNGGTLQYSSANTIDYSSVFSMAAGQQYNVDTNGQNVTWASALTSPGGSLVKRGGGVLTLLGSNTYDGGTVVNGGTLAIASDDSLGSSTGVVTLNGGTLSNATDSLLIVSHDIVLGASGGTLDAGNRNLFIEGDISGAGGLTMTGSGEVLLASVAALTYTGATVVDSEDAQIDASTMASSSITVSGNSTLNLIKLQNYAGSVSGDGLIMISGPVSLTGTASTTFDVSGSTLQIGNGGTTGSLSGDVYSDGPGGTLVFNRSDTTTYAGNLSGNMTLTQLGTGTLVVSGNNSYIGPTNLDAGVLSLESGTALGFTSVINWNGGTLQYSSANTNDYSSLFSTNPGQQYNIDTNGQNVTWATGLTSNGGILVKSGSGTLTLSGTNTYDGGTTISGGSLLAGNTTALRSGTSGAAYTINGGTLDLNNFNLTISSLSGTGGNIALGTATLTVDQTGTTTFAGAITGAGGFTKLGSGELTLSGTSNFSGALSPNAGTLNITGSVTTSATSGIATLGGSATVNITGPGGNWTSNADTLIGLDGGTGYLNISGGATASDTFSLVGRNSTSDAGYVTVTGPGSTWTHSAGIVIGTGGVGSMLVQNGGQVSNTDATIGDNAGSNGTVRVTGANSLWNSTSMVIGASGNGVLNVDSGGIVKVGSTGTDVITLGHDGTASGILNIGAAVGQAPLDPGIIQAATITGGSGTGVKLVNFNHTGTDYIFAPNLTGSLSVQQNAGVTVLTGTSTYSGDTTVDFGTLAVSGTGASITQSSASFYTGYANGDNGTTQVKDGGQISNLNGYIGFNFGSTGNVTVDGVGSVWTSAGTLTVGVSGTATLSVSDGGMVQVGSGTGTLTLAKSAGSVGTLNIGNGGLAGTVQTTTIIGGLGTGVVNFDESDSSYTFAPNLSGSLSLNQIGTGTTILTGANNYNQATIVSNGTLEVLGTHASINQTSASFYTGFANGDNGTTLIKGGGQVLDFFGYIGYNSGSTGTVTITGAGSSWHNSNSTTVGNSGTGILTVSNGGQVSDFNGDIGLNSGSTGNVMVTGNGSLWSNTSSLIVGGSGTATLTVSNGGVVQVGGGTGNLILAQSSGSFATLNIGDGDLAGTLQVGKISFGSGTAVLNFDESDAAYTFALNLSGRLSLNQIGTGTTIFTGTNSYSGNTTVDFGTLAVSGAGASFTQVGATFYTGFANGDNGTTLIKGGGGVSDALGYIGYNSGSTGNVTVSDSNSSWSNTFLTVGNSGTGMLTISNGGQVSDSNGDIGLNSSSTGNVTVTGSDSLWNNSSLIVGSSGTATLTVSNGGMVQVGGGTGTLFLALDSGSLATLNIGDGGLAGTLQVSKITLGSGTAVLNFDESDAAYTFAFNLSGNLSLNQIGTGTTILTGTNTYTQATTVSNGALEVLGTGASITQTSANFYTGFANGDNGTTLITGGGRVSDLAGYIGFNLGSTGNATVDGAGSRWTNTGTGTLIVGNSGTGTLTVSNGGTVSDVNGYLGLNSSSTGSATIADAGSTWSNTTGLEVGGSGTGTLTVSNGGQVSDKNAWLGFNSGSTGTAMITGTGSFWSTGATLIVGNMGMGTLAISSGAQVSDVSGFIGGIGGTGDVTVSGTGSSWSNSSLTVGTSGRGTLSISNGGQVSDMSGIIGNVSGSTGNATVTGIGSSWTNSVALTVGSTGTATLTVSDGSVIQVAGGLGTVILAKNSGSVSALNIGDDGAAGFVQAATITGGSGIAVVNFDETDASYTFVPQLTGSLSVNQIGTGTTILSGTNTYSGGTQINAGTLIAANNSALGAGNVNVSGGTLQIDQGFSVANAITLSGGSLAQRVNAGTQLSTLHSATSGFSGGTTTAAHLLGGVSSGATTILGSYSRVSAAPNDNVRISDVFTLSGVSVVDESTGQTDTFVLQLKLDPSLVTLNSELGWLDPQTNLWTTAVNGNIGGSATFIAGAYNAATDDQLGDYGVDPTTGTVWAVLDHNSSFAVVSPVPEPSTWLLFGLGLAVLVPLSRRCKR